MTKTEKNELIAIIRKSPLPAKSKDRIIKGFETATENDDVFKIIDAELAAHVRESTPTVEKSILYLQKEFKKIDEEYSLTREILDKNLSLAMIEAGRNGADRDSVWDAYYRQLEIARSRYEKDLKSATAKAALAS